MQINVKCKDCGKWMTFTAEELSKSLDGSSIQVELFFTTVSNLFQNRSINRKV